MSNFPFCLMFSDPSRIPPGRRVTSGATRGRVLPCRFTLELRCTALPPRPIPFPAYDEQPRCPAPRAFLQNLVPQAVFQKPG